MKKINIDLILFFSLTAMYECVAVFKISSKLMYFPMLIILFREYTVNKNKCTIKKTYGIFGIFLFFTYFICSLLSGEVLLNDFSYWSIIFIFYFFIPILGRKISENTKNTIIALLLGNTVFIIPQIIQNITGIHVSQIKDSLSISGAARYNRNYFGYSHPNTAALMFSVDLILLTILFMMINNKKIKGIIIISIISLILCVLSTGSRTAIISYMLFLIFYILLMIFENNIIFKIGGAIFVTVLSIWYFVENSLISAFAANSSGRVTNASNILKLLSEQGRTLFGVGVHQISAGQISNILNSKNIIDSWYVYILASSGMIGVASILIGLMIVFGGFLMSVHDRKKRILMCALILYIMIYGITENVVFIPGVLLSVIVWGLIYSQSFETSSKVQ